MKHKPKPVVNRLAWGAEPTWDSSKKLIENCDEISHAYNWYKAMSNSKDQMNWTLEYLQKHNESEDYIKQVSKLSEKEIYPVGSICRMSMLGANLPQFTIDKITKLLKDKLDKVKILEAPIEKKIKKISMDGPVALALVEFDLLLEQIRKRKLKEFVPNNLSFMENLIPSQLKNVFKHYKTSLDMLSNALDGDGYAKEAYCHFTRSQQALAVQYIQAIENVQLLNVETAQPKLPNEKVQKVKSPEQLVKKLLYLGNDTELVVKSIKPEIIIGCNELWIYHTRLRKLGCYHSESLSVKGSTILNYSVETSLWKTLRKPKQQLEEFMNCSKKQMREYWQNIHSTGQKMSPRTSRETLLLKAYR